MSSTDPLHILQEEIRSRVEDMTSAYRAWPCRKGCDDCCRRLASLPVVTLTNRPNSYVPAETLGRLLGKTPGSPSGNLSLNWSVHWGQGILLGLVHGVMAGSGVRGPVGPFFFMNLCLLNDQTLENATAAGVRLHGHGPSWWALSPIT